MSQRVALGLAVRRDGGISCEWTSGSVNLFPVQTCSLLGYELQKRVLGQLYGTTKLDRGNRFNYRRVEGNQLGSLRVWLNPISEGRTCSALHKEMEGQDTGADGDLQRITIVVAA